MNIPESVLRSCLVVGDKRISPSSDVGMLAYSVLADAYLRELDEMPITADELVKDGWEDKGCIYGPTTSKQLVWNRGQDVLARYISKESDQWELVGVPEFELQTMGELRTVLRLRGESA